MNRALLVRCWASHADHAGADIVALMVVVAQVERAKKCLDFASTCYFFHFVGCWVHSGFPTSLAW